MKELSGLVRLSFILVALYLVLRYGAQSRRLLGTAFGGWRGLVTDLQGR